MRETVYLVFWNGHGGWETPNMYGVYKNKNSMYADLSESLESEWKIFDTVPGGMPDDPVEMIDAYNEYGYPESPAIEIVKYSLDG